MCRQIFLYFLCILTPIFGTNPYLTPSLDVTSIISRTKILDKSNYDDLSIETRAKMFDASTKIPTGILDGNFFDFGNFDECYNIYENKTYGKYCLGTIHPGLLSINVSQRKTTPNITPRLVGLGETYIGFHFAVCVPSTTQIEDIPGVLTFDFCYSKDTEPELSTGAIVTIAILGFFSCIIVLSTIFDIILYYTDKKSPHELLIAFSFFSNGRKLFSSSTNPEQLLCLNGMRAISMMWVLISHDYFLILYAGFSNYYYMQEWENDPANMFILGATVSVDTFFTIGGVVTVYTFLKSVDKGIKFNIVLYYIHRYLRLTPALVISALVYTFILPYLGNGPLWNVIDLALVEPCKEAWWSTLLYITNYIQKGACVPQSWYLAADMQMFVLSPLVLIPLSIWPKYGLMILVGLAIAGCAIPFGIGFGENLGNSSDPNYNNVYYIQPYTRFGPYVIGMILGYIIYKTKKSGKRIKMNPVTVTWLWCLSLTGLVACLYAGHDLAISTEEDRWGNSLFLAFNRPAWALSLCGVIFLCVNGHGGPANYLLSLPIFQFVAKISYSMYLVHFAVLMVRYSSMRQTFRFTNLLVMHNFWGDFMLTLVLSVVLCLAFESPIIILEKYLFGSKKSQDKSKMTPKQ